MHGKIPLFPRLFLFQRARFPLSTILSFNLRFSSSSSHQGKSAIGTTKEGSWNFMVEMLIVVRASVRIVTNTYNKCSSTTIWSVRRVDTTTLSSDINTKQ
ncbi:hypothetical protein P3S67_022933 [Capsicum chacoense]